MIDSLRYANGPSVVDLEALLEADLQLENTYLEILRLCRCQTTTLSITSQPQKKN